jgi:hypothetical protein
MSQTENYPVSFTSVVPTFSLVFLLTLRHMPFYY